MRSTELEGDSDFLWEWVSKSLFGGGEFIDLESPLSVVVLADDESVVGNLNERSVLSDSRNEFLWERSLISTAFT